MTRARGGEAAARAGARAFGALLTVLLVLLGLAAAPAPAAFAADNGRWSVFPAPAAGAKDRSPTAQERPFFTLEADPGTTLRDKVSVSNLSGEPMTFRLYGADAYNTPRDGGFAVRGADEKNTDVGSWVRLARSSLTVPARTRADIPFTVTVPADASPGDHPGAIVALDTHVDTAAGDVRVGVRRAVGARIHLRVAGPGLGALSVEHITAGHTGPLFPGTGDSQATIRYTLVNRGNVSLTPRLAVTAKGLFGRTLLDRRARTLPLELLPGQRVELTEHWAGAPQLDRVTVRLRVTAAGGDVDETGSASYLAVPWAAVGLVAALLGVLLFWLVRIRGRRRAQDPDCAAQEYPRRADGTDLAARAGGGPDGPGATGAAVGGRTA
ncbi:WxL protein peptidoglycan domain-containing protein [Streptomyces sp. NPDC001070]